MQHSGEQRSRADRWPPQQLPAPVLGRLPPYWCSATSGAEHGHHEGPLLRPLDPQEQPGGREAPPHQPQPPQMFPILRHLLPHRRHHAHLDGAGQPDAGAARGDGEGGRRPHPLRQPLGHVQQVGAAGQV